MFTFDQIYIQSLDLPHSNSTQLLIKWLSILYDFASVCLNLIWLSIGVPIIRDFLHTFFSICCQQAALQVFGREIQHPSFAVKESGGVTQMMRPREFVQSWVCKKHW